MVSIFGGCYSVINRLAAINAASQEIGTIAGNKMEEIKSGYVYIDNDKYLLLNLGEDISFEERNHNINISIKPLDDHEGIICVNLEVSNEKENISYNLIRYINLCRMIAGE